MGNHSIEPKIEKIHEMAREAQERLFDAEERRRDADWNMACGELVALATVLRECFGVTPLYTVAGGELSPSVRCEMAKIKQL